MPWFNLVNFRTRGRSASSARQPHYFINHHRGSQRVLCASSPALTAYLSVLAASTPQYPQSPDTVWQAHWIILPSQVGEIQQRGLAVQRWRLARCWVRCLACFCWKCGYVIFPHVVVEKKNPSAALGRTENVNKILSFFFLSLALCTLWPCVSLPALAWRISSFALDFTVLEYKCFVTVFLFAWTQFLVRVRRKMVLRTCRSKEHTWGQWWSQCDYQMLPVCVRTALSLFNWLWLLARDQLSHAFVSWTWDRTGNGRDILFLRDAVIVLMGEFLARKTPFTVIGCE